ncbi:hypothetical protein [Anaerorhabdus sp.]|uniref:hypothetical protein n=1 Tax=Anaerorhabdus sp. TaxID=1872524 RepID=UPI002FCBAF17
MRILIRILILTLFLSGCQSKNTNEIDSKKLDEYKSIYQTLLQSTATSEAGTYFDISTEVTHLPDDTYRYYVIVDNASTSMYNVKMIALEVGSDSETIMAPSIGILDGEVYNLIPSQVSMQEGFVKGLVLSGDSVNSEINLKIMISWTDEKGKKQEKEYFDITCTAPSEQ